MPFVPATAAFEVPAVADEVDALPELDPEPEGVAMAVAVASGAKVSAVGWPIDDAPVARATNALRSLVAPAAGGLMALIDEGGRRWGCQHWGASRENKNENENNTGRGMEWSGGMEGGD